MTTDLLQQLHGLHEQGQLDLPLPGSGTTAERHNALVEVGRLDLALARLVEAHVDAVAILAENERRAERGTLYGVWASDGPQSRLVISRQADGGLILDGVKKYCSGAGQINAALITAWEDDARFLVQVPLNAQGITVDVSDWVSAAFANTTTGTVTFHNVRVEGSALIGGPDWYLTRSGFWHGALGPAACWAGGAIGLIDAVRKVDKDDPHFRAHKGALEAIEWGLRALLTDAGRQIDADPRDDSREARRRALKCRHLIERHCMEVLDRFGRATGPSLLAFDRSLAQRHLELTLYIRQCHAERDLESIVR